MSRIVERILADELRAIIDRAHEDALLTEEWLALSTTLQPIVDDATSAASIIAVETAKGIEWGAPLTQPLSVEKVRAAFAAIERGENPDD